MWRLVLLYNLQRWVVRPAIVKRFGNGRYRQHKKLFYTIITGQYDQLKEIRNPPENWDFLCFTDNPDITSSTWRICPLDNPLGLDSVRLSRYLKINSHLVEQGYDITVYGDANLTIRGDLDVFLAQALPVDVDFAILQHPFLSSLAEEMQLCIAEGKESEDILTRQYQHYVREMGFDDHLPHVNARLIIRRSGNPEIRQMMEVWFAELCRWSRRDQMSFNYALSRCPDVRLHYIPYWIFRTCFKRMDHR